MPKVNPEILKWARVTSGLTLEEAVKKLGLIPTKENSSLERLAALEAGKITPTRAMLKKMEKSYRRPLLTFYLKDIPCKSPRKEDFRTLPNSTTAIDVGLVDAVVRDIQARQSSVRSCLEIVGEARSLSFIGSMNNNDGVHSMVNSIKETLEFNLEAFRGKRKPQEAFAYFRTAAEEAGIFVILIDNLGSYHSTIKVETLRGLALSDEIAPFIAINANDSPRAYSFTLAHELAHLWLGNTGVSSGAITHKTIETFCNDVASEFLLPNEEINKLQVKPNSSLKEIMAQIRDFATDHMVSNTLVAYKLHRVGALSLPIYQELHVTFRKFYLTHKEAEKEKSINKGSGPTYYNIRKHRLGKSLIKFVERMIWEGYLSPTKAGKVLGVNASNVFTLIEPKQSKHSF